MITLALIGLGRWGINFLKTIKNIPDCRIKYIAASTKDTLSLYSDKYIKTTNYKDFLKYDDIDGVIISTPASTHYKILNDFVPKNIYCFVEKPLITNIKDLSNAKKYLTIKTSKIMLGYIYLYNPALSTLKNNLSKIGNIRYISFKLCNFGPFSEGVSPLWELSPHGVSICLYLLNDYPQEVSAFGISSLKPASNLFDNICIRLKFKNNITCLLEVGWLFPQKKRELIVFGEKSTFILDDLADKKLTLHKNLGPLKNGEHLLGQEPESKYLKYSLLTPLQAELQEFIKFIKKSKPPISNLNFSLNVESIVYAAEQSLTNNGKVITLNHINSKI